MKPVIVILILMLCLSCSRSTIKTQKFERKYGYNASELFRQKPEVKKQAVNKELSSENDNHAGFNWSVGNLFSGFFSDDEDEEEAQMDLVVNECVEVINENETIIDTQRSELNKLRRELNQINNQLNRARNQSNQRKGQIDQLQNDKQKLEGLVNILKSEIK